MKFIYKNTLAVLFLLVLLVSCRSDDITEVVTVDRPDPTIIEGYTPTIKPITSSVRGHVIDENGENVGNAFVYLDDITTTTNEYGHFFINDAEMNEAGTFVRVEKDGFFDGSRRFYPKDSKASNVVIELLQKNRTSTFAASLGGVVAVEGGASILFPPNVFIDENNVAYEGEVHVSSKWLDPTAFSTSNQMPGDLTGVDELNETVALSTYGMMAVELESPNGAPLNLAENASASLTFPVPSELLSTAPSEIPLWYFNEHYGIWVQEGQATLQGSVYVGDVHHFSFWNCDYPNPVIQFDATIVDDFGNPLVAHLVKINLGNVGSGSGYTDFQGYVSGWIPANEILTLEIYSQCNELMYTQSIGPFASATSLGSIAVVPTGAHITTMTGNLLNCDGMPVTNGLVIAEFGSFREYYYTDGTPFTLSISTCANTNSVTVVGIDFNNPGHTSEDVVPAGVFTNLNNVYVCNAGGPQDFISVEVEGISFTYSNATDSVSIYTDALFVESFLDVDKRCLVYLADPTIGLQNGYISILQLDLGWDLRSSVAIELTEYGPNDGDKIVGSYNGLLNDFINGGTKTVDLTFDLIKGD